MFFGGVGAVTSQRLVGQCFAAGNKECIDGGFQGLVFLVAVIFLMVALVRAFSISNE